MNTSHALSLPLHRVLVLENFCTMEENNEHINALLAREYSIVYAPIGSSSQNKSDSSIDIVLKTMCVCVHTCLYMCACAYTMCVLASHVLPCLCLCPVFVCVCVSVCVCVRVHV